MSAIFITYSRNLSGEFAKRSTQAYTRASQLQERNGEWRQARRLGLLYKGLADTAEAAASAAFREENKAFRRRRRRQKD